VLICSERKVLPAGCWWLVCWLVADKPNEQGMDFEKAFDKNIRLS
jgi:hypothetical protein